MKWNWQQKDWTKFTYKSNALKVFEEKFIYISGMIYGAYIHINEEDKNNFTIDLICDEAIKTSEIEGEYLNRDSVQSSIRRNFGLDAATKKSLPAEQGVSEMMVDLYKNFNNKLSHEILFEWHEMLMKGRRDLFDIGKYRTHEEPMQIISGPMHNPKVHFEAPPSNEVADYMNKFIDWFNNSSPNGNQPVQALVRAAIAHLYFECIHPFEDGNGRIGRALSEKILSQSIGRPSLIALSYAITKNKKLYYELLEKSNKSNEITEWIEYFANLVLEAQEYTKTRIDFLIKKAKIFDSVRGKINERQEKILIRLFKEGVDGFKGGLSAENYISITKASRATATRDLADLVQQNILVKQGERKHTRYYLNI